LGLRSFPTRRSSDLLEAGDRLSVTGTLERPRGSFGAYLRHRGYPASLLIDAVRRTAGPSNPVMRAAGALRSVLRTSLERVFHPRDRKSTRLNSSHLG